MRIVHTSAPEISATSLWDTTRATIACSLSDRGDFLCATDDGELLAFKNEDVEQLRDRKLELEAEVVRLKEIVEQAEELNREHVELKNETWLRIEQVRIKDEQLQAMPTTTLADYLLVRDQPFLLAVRDRVLKSLTSGKGKVASTSPQFKTAAKALDRFILELRESTPVSTHDSETSPDGTAALLVDEAIKKLESKLYTKDEYYADLRQITERCGYRLFIDNTTLSLGRELFIVNPPGNATERVVSTQDIGEVLAWLRRQDAR